MKKIIIMNKTVFIFFKYLNIVFFFNLESKSPLKKLFNYFLLTILIANIY